SRKAIQELGDTVTAAEKENIEEACKELEAATKCDDKQAIEAKTKALEEAFAPIAQKDYAEQAQAAGAQGVAKAEVPKNVVDV
ncbi:molecular chaperone DnaK, partial [Francisella tularensis subsp. holarctica]|uniref:Hsp70 family protein n=1 Tax=Francisella tularensis TaxID=263 RepID=UPI0023ADB8E3|nr:molecular chaperone DnaK [Francisella tularensis subsp. holarctica]